MTDPEARRALHALRGADFAAQVSLAADATWALRFALDSAAVQSLLARRGPELDTLVLDRLAELAAVQVDLAWANPHEAELVGLLALATHGLTPASLPRVKSGANLATTRRGARARRAERRLVPPARRRPGDDPRRFADWVYGLSRTPVTLSRTPVTGDVSRSSGDVLGVIVR